MPNKYLIGYLPININVIVITKIIKAVDKFDGSINKTIIIDGIQRGKIESLNLISLSEFFER